MLVGATIVPGLSLYGYVLHESDISCKCLCNREYSNQPVTSLVHSITPPQW